MRRVAAAACLLASLAAGSVAAQRPESDLRRDLARTFIHGVTEGDARAMASEADVPALLWLLSDASFERPDNAAAVLVHLAGEDAVPALAEWVRRAPGGPVTPEADRSRLLVPQALAGVAERSGEAGFSALLDLAGDERLSPELRGLAAGELGRLGLPGYVEPPSLPERPRPALADSAGRVDRIPLTFANHVDLENPMDAERLDLNLSIANLRAGRSDFPEDSSCCVQVERSGPARSFGTPGDGLDVIDDAVEFQAVRTESSARVKVVRLIRHCFGNDAPNIGGCAEISGDSMVVVRFGSATIEGLVWLHEYGHNTGIADHSADDRFIMSAFTGLQDVAVSEGECLKFHQPEPGTAITLLDGGACVDLDGDQVQDGIDNCRGLANSDQEDLDLDGEGDACDPDDDGDGVPDELDQCPGEADGADDDGDGVPSCLDDCPSDPNKTEPGQCGCGIFDVDADGDGLVNCLDGCPLDGDKIHPGACGCGSPDDDADGDQTPDCLDACPLDAEKTEPGACGCGVSEDDADSDGTPDCSDDCPLDAEKITPGACGCGESEADGDGDGSPDCVDGCPSDPGKNAAGDCGCGVPDLDGDGDGLADCLQCALGDAWPPAGDGVVDLSDWVALQRRVGSGEAGALRCLDLAPASVACASEGRCPGGDGSLDAADVALVRGLAGGTRTLDCRACPPSPPSSATRRPGDVSPPGAAGAAASEVGDGLVDVADVLQLLRWSVQLDEPPGREAFLRGDVSPPSDGAVEGDGVLDVSDVLSVLRAAVGLAELRWPLRSLVVELEPTGAIVAAQLEISNLPPWVLPVEDLEAACLLEGRGASDDGVGRAVISCSWDPLRLSAAADVAVFGHLSPEPFTLEGEDSPRVTARAVDAELAPVAATARWASGG